MDVNIPIKWRSRPVEQESVCLLCDTVFRPLRSLSANKSNSSTGSHQ